MRFFGGLVALKPGVDGLALSPDRSQLYFAAMSHDGLFRIPTQALRDAQRSPTALATEVVRVGRKPLSDGITVDPAGNVLVTDVEHSAVHRLSPQGELSTLVASPRVRWSDNLAVGPDGWVYLADSAIPDQMLRSRRHIASRAPYFVYRFPLGTAPSAAQEMP